MASVLDHTLSALADPTRRGVIELLRDRPHRAGELAEAFHMSAPAMSRHLKVLRTRGLVLEKAAPDDARARIYELRREPFQELSSWVREVESFWTDQLSAFKAHVESKQRAKAKSATRPNPRSKPKAKTQPQGKKK